MTTRKTDKTRSKIQSAFLELLEEKRIGAISAKEIMEKAGGTRTTFYNHFQDIYDLRDTIINDTINDMKTIINDFFHSRSKISDWHDIYELNYLRFRYIYERQDLFRTLFSKPCFKDFKIKLRDTMNANLSRQFQNYYSSYIEFSGKNNEYYTYVMATAFIGSIEYWIMNDFRISPEMISRYFTRGFFQDLGMPLPPR
ncbi:MAG: TetR/AcrR family transcriptional regulator [Erysipelotrichaceae bacterium]|nr:TetR/AcrR family transcriptional regulator [Erysipelotrichaceae bacterium]